LPDIPGLGDLEPMEVEEKPKVEDEEERKFHGMQVLLLILYLV
jgi:hypothetical protein